MPKTISLREEAYERLKRARRHASESFSDVVMRASWERNAVTAGDYLRLVRERGPLYSDSELAEIEEVSAADSVPVDKWAQD
jgi:predicted CopG family antitoxin